VFIVCYLVIHDEGRRGPRVKRLYHSRLFDIRCVNAQGARVMEDTMSVNISDLKDKVIDGASATDLNSDELAECLEFCRKTWEAWRKSNAAAEMKRKAVAAAIKDPAIKALLAAKGISL
jgi:hypothetical protein